MTRIGNNKRPNFILQSQLRAKDRRGKPRARLKGKDFYSITISEVGGQNHRIRKSVEKKSTMYIVVDGVR